MLLTIATNNLLSPHASLIQNDFALVRTYGVVMFRVIDVVTTMSLVVLYLITNI
jgi:hypothetical protein